MTHYYLMCLCDNLRVLSGKKINHEVHKVLSRGNTNVRSNVTPNLFGVLFLELKFKLRCWNKFSKTIRKIRYQDYAVNALQSLDEKW